MNSLLNDSQIFRSKVFKTHYELSGGDMFKPVLRTDVVSTMGMADYNDDELINTVVYLDQKGYLGSGSNITENITVQGIDEYENGFPTLGRPVDMQEIDFDLLNDLVSQIDAAEDLAKQGLLNFTERAELQTKVQQGLDESIPKDTILWRKYDKERRVTRWSNAATITGYVTENNHLIFWRGFIEEILISEGADAQPNKLIINQNEPFTARSTIRSLLGGAKKSIYIIDNYASDIVVLRVLETYKRNMPTMDKKFLQERQTPTSYPT